MKNLFRKKYIFLKFNAILFIGLIFLLANTKNSFANKSSLKLKINDIEENLAYSTLADWFEFTPYLITDNSYDSEIENINYYQNQEDICLLTNSLQDKYHIQKNVHFSVNESSIAFYVSTLSQKVNKNTKDAKIKFNEETEKVEIDFPENDGLSLNIPESTQIIIDTITANTELPENVELSYKIEKADVRSDNLKSLGINKLVGEGKSNFHGSTKTRIHNIKTAVNKFDGLLLKPEEEFSFVDTLGPVDGESGYKEELVIKKDETVKEFGGGICQVSTTTFRAAIYSGLAITARRNHAYPVHYYAPQGMDAAIYLPKPDLKFVNNTPNHILVQVEIKEDTNDLFFRFYGTSDKRKVEVKGPFVTEKNPDGSMRTYFTQKVFDKNGELVIDEVFRSFYASPDKYPRS
ncbi:MAG: VanW family protein [Candidatus Moranbacteria bacterium]|nr:VanW family protein [Candidatus Moranbacteria bacterium]